MPVTGIARFVFFLPPLRLDPERDGAAFRQQIARKRVVEQGSCFFCGAECLPGEARNKFQISGFLRHFFSPGHRGFGRAVEGQVEEQFRRGFLFLRRRKRGE